MSTFANRMLEAKHTKQDARNRGHSIGDYRGTVKPRPLDTAPDDWLERAFAEIARPKRSTARQNAAAGPLFGDQAQQIDLMDLLR